MARATSRRPLPALVFLLALIALTAIVWIRVLSRDGSAKALPACPTSTSVVLPQPSGVTLQVLNSTQRDHLAHTVATTLGADGFKITTVGNDGQPVKGVAEIRYAPSGLGAAQLLSYYLPGATLVSADLPSSAVVVSLGATFNAVATPTAVHSKLVQAKVSQAPVAAKTSGAAKSSAPAAPSTSAAATCVSASPS